MKKRLVVVFILLLALLLIQVFFYAETIARTKPHHIESCARRINYILEEVVKPEHKKTLEKTEMRIEVLNKIDNRKAMMAEKRKEKEEEVIIEESPSYTLAIYYTDGHLTPESGIYWYGDQKETYYNLPMDGVVSAALNNGLKGEYWVRDDGCKMFGDYIILACNRSVHPYGSIVETSLGYGISLDTGGFADGDPYQVDIAVNW